MRPLTGSSSKTMPLDPAKTRWPTISVSDMVKPVSGRSAYQRSPRFWSRDEMPRRGLPRRSTTVLSVGQKLSNWLTACGLSEAAKVAMSVTVDDVAPAPVGKWLRMSSRLIDVPPSARISVMDCCESWAVLLVAATPSPPFRP